MKTPRIKKPFIRFSKTVVFILTLSSIVLFSSNANVALKNIGNEYRSSFSHPEKNIEPQTMFLLGVGLLGFAGVSRRHIRK